MRSEIRPPSLHGCRGPASRDWKLDWKIDDGRPRRKQIHKTRYVNVLQLGSGPSVLYFDCAWGLEVSERLGEGNTQEQNSSILSDDDLALGEAGKCDCMREQGEKMGEGSKGEG